VAILNGIVAGLAVLGESAWAAISGLASFLLTKAGEWLSTLGTIGGKVVSFIVGGVTGLAGDIWDKIKELPGDLLEKIKKIGGLFGEIGTAIGDFIIDAAKTAVAGLADILKAAVLSPIRFIAKAIYNNWPDIPGLPGPPDFLNSLRTVGLAEGGIVTGPTLAVVGEAGTEAVVPLNRAREFGFGGGGITINVQAGLVSTPDQIGQQIIEAIQQAQRRSGPVFAAA
jgi:hypothetical protein